MPSASRKIGGTLPVRPFIDKDKTMKLYLGNLPFAAADNDIRDAFSSYGTIEDLFIPLDRETNRPRGFAFLTLTDDDLARKAIEEMNGSELLGRNIRVTEAEERRPQQNRGGGGGNRRSGGNERRGSGERRERREGGESSGDRWDNEERRDRNHRGGGGRDRDRRGGGDRRRKGDHDEW